MSSNQTTVHCDWQIIEDLGGATEVAKLLGYDKKRGGIQRIHNWRVRGIPSAVKVAHPGLFMKEVVSSLDASDDAQPPVGRIEVDS
ncbi:hypothetical protein CNE_1c11770 [Cupriavidus necator N-1]|uniref:Uncharacterized protein n=1 Tax=Cupriavidus necator (strain ATCC 43291 / DSM 13513 / CCUG 52238 / LMG 8453 / N-1) TaxID=1042878 RepID=G0ER14_CUPNN|nr:hypothetical protein [Cupriavidus necator]AEI76532.1 hypothetical protein CNE_1c11770 [Cupriavidus necator N-1]MDX6011346.1 hypothetical protein [Cupriavidus necator]